MSTATKRKRTPPPVSAVKKATRRADTVPARARAKLAPGEVVRMMRELHSMSQAKLAELTGIAQPTISGIEAERIVIGAERAEKLARALKVHPAVILWPNWEEDEKAAPTG